MAEYVGMLQGETKAWTFQRNQKSVHWKKNETRLAPSWAADKQGKCHLSKSSVSREKNLR